MEADWCKPAESRRPYGWHVTAWSFLLALMNFSGVKIVQIFVYSQALHIDIRSVDNCYVLSYVPVTTE